MNKIIVFGPSAENTGRESERRRAYTPVQAAASRTRLRLVPKCLAALRTRRSLRNWISTAGRASKGFSPTQAGGRLEIQPSWIVTASLQRPRAAASASARLRASDLHVPLRRAPRPGIDPLFGCGPRQSTRPSSGCKTPCAQMSRARPKPFLWLSSFFWRLAR